jgi:ribonuclease HI
MAKKKYYVIWIGYQIGIVDSWEECQNRTNGYKGAKFKSFKTLAEAQKAFEMPWTETTSAPAKKSSYPPPKNPSLKNSKPIKESLSVDAACSGNPGLMEYRGVHVKTKAEWFRMAFSLGTNNIGEFLGIVHGLAELKRRKLNIPVYTDSTIAMKWIRKKKCGTKLPRTPETEELFKLIERAETWLNQNTFDQPLLKWDTKAWGEIPADFGRK